MSTIAVLHGGLVKWFLRTLCGVLTEAGVGGWELVWGSGVQFAIGPEFAEAIDVAVAVADPPDTTPAARPAGERGRRR